MNPVEIPQRAVHLAADEVEYYGVDKSDRHKAAWEALDVAAPYIVASELERLHEAISDPVERHTVEDVLDLVQGRINELRDVGE